MKKWKFKGKYSKNKHKKTKNKTKNLLNIWKFLILTNKIESKLITERELWKFIIQKKISLYNN